MLPFLGNIMGIITFLLIVNDSSKVQVSLRLRRQPPNHTQKNPPFSRQFAPARQFLVVEFPHCTTRACHSCGRMRVQIWALALVLKGATRVQIRSVAAFSMMSLWFNLFNYLRAYRKVSTAALR